MQVVLQAFAQVPGIHVYYGPDTYMGRNLAVMLRSVSQLSNEEISALHPAHNRATVKVHARIQCMATYGIGPYCALLSGTMQIV